MAIIYLDPKANAADANFTVSGGSTVHGNTDATNQIVNIPAGVSGVTLDGNVNGEMLSGAVSAYTFKQLGSALGIYNAAGTSLISTLSVSSAGDALTFANGTVQVQSVAPVISAAGVITTPATITVGGTTVSATNNSDTATSIAAPVIVTPATINTAIVTPPTTTGGSTAPTGPTSSWAKVSLGTGIDNLTATTPTVFSAPIINNSNTLQSGDTIIGSGSDILKATIGNSQAFAISPTTVGVTTIQLQAQANSIDSTNNNLSQTNQTQIDAQNITSLVSGSLPNQGGITYIDDNSRSDLIIEDIRLSDSNTSLSNNADASEVVLNPNSTINTAATNAAGITTWQVTQNDTIAFVSSDPGHVDFGVYFDPNSLRAGPAQTSTTSTLTLELVDSQGALSGKPLLTNNYAAVTIVVNGKDVSIPITNTAGSPVQTSYADLLTAIQAGITTASATNPSLVGVTAAIGGNFTISNANGTPVTGTSIILTSTSGSILSGAQPNDGSGWVNAGQQSSTSNLFATLIPGVPNTIVNSPLVTSTIILDDVGRGAMGGNFVDGSLATGDTSNSIGVSQFNITVDRTSALESINSTNNALKVVNIVNGIDPVNATGIHNGNLSVTGQVVSGNNASANQAGTIALGIIAAPVNLSTVAASSAGTTTVTTPNATAGVASGTAVAVTNPVSGLVPPSAVGGTTTSGVGQPLPGVVTANGGSQFNQYGFNDVQTINASQLTGSFTYTAAITNASIAKYDNLATTAPAVASSDIVPFMYTGSNGGTTATVAIDPQALATQTNELGGRQEFTLAVNGGNGGATDANNLTVGIYTTRTADGAYAPAGNTDAWYQNQALNANVTVNGGAGVDTVNTPGAGNKVIDVSKSISAAVYTDNTGREVVSDPNNSAVTLAQTVPTGSANAALTYPTGGEALATATWLINAADQTTVNSPSRNLNNLTANFNDTYALFDGQLKVTFDGYTSSTVTIPQLASGSYLTSDEQINQAIKLAINSDPVLSKLLLAQDGPAAGLVITSKIDGVYNAGDLAVNISAPTAAQLTTLVSQGTTSLAAIYNAQHGSVTTNSFTTQTTAPTAASIAAEQGTAIAQNNGSATPIQLFSTSSVQGWLTSAGNEPIALANDGTKDITGANSVTTSDNTIMLGAGATSAIVPNDVVVLGTTAGGTTLASSNEVVQLSPANSVGKFSDVIVHFDGGADTGQDTIDLSKLFGTPSQYAGAYSSAAPSVTATSVKQQFDVTVQNLVTSGTGQNDTQASVATLAKTLFATDYTSGTTLKTQANGLHFDHVLLVQNTSGSAVADTNASGGKIPAGATEVYTIDNGQVTDQGTLNVLGVGGQANGGAELSVATLLANGSFGTVSASTGGTTTVTPGTTGIALGESAATINNGGSVSFTASLASGVAPAGGITVPYTLSGSAVTASGISPTATTGTITIQAGNSSGTSGNITDVNSTTGAETLIATIGTLPSAYTATTISQSVVLNGITTGSGTQLTVGPSTVSPIAAVANETFNITSPAAAGYSDTITGFQAGDKIVSPANVVNKLVNASYTDGSVVLTYSAGGNSATITLTGLTIAQDVGINAATDLNTVFGTGTFS